MAPSYPIPATPPPAGVAPAQQAQADQIWDRAAGAGPGLNFELPTLSF